MAATSVRLSEHVLAQTRREHRVPFLSVQRAWLDDVLDVWEKKSVLKPYVCDECVFFVFGRRSTTLPSEPIAYQSFASTYDVYYRSGSSTSSSVVCTKRRRKARKPEQRREYYTDPELNRPAPASPALETMIQEAIGNLFTIFHALNYPLVYKPHLGRRVFPCPLLFSSLPPEQLSDTESDLWSEGELSSSASLSMSSSMSSSAEKMTTESSHDDDQSQEDSGGFALLLATLVAAGHGNAEHDSD